MKSCRKSRKVSLPLPDRRAPGLCRAEKPDIHLRSEEDQTDDLVRILDQTIEEVQ